MKYPYGFIILTILFGLISMFSLWVFFDLNLLVGFSLGVLLGFLEDIFDRKHKKHGKVVAVTTIKGQGVEIVDLSNLKKQTKKERNLAKFYGYLSDGILGIIFISLFIAIIIYFFT
jgi:hypothetical protein